MLEKVLNVTWHAQHASAIDPSLWADTNRNPLIDSDPRNVYLLPDLRFQEQAKKAKLTLDTSATAVFSPLRQRDAKPSNFATTCVRIMMGTAWPNNERMTQFGAVTFDSVQVFTEHGLKKGAETDLANSKAAPSLALAHGHHNSLTTAGMYQVWELEETDEARALLSQPRFAAAGVKATHIDILRELQSCRLHYEQQVQANAQLRAEDQQREADWSARLVDEQTRHRAMVSDLAATCMQLATTAASLQLANGTQASATSHQLLGQMLQLTTQVRGMAQMQHAGLHPITAPPPAPIANAMGVPMHSSTPAVPTPAVPTPAVHVPADVAVLEAAAPTIAQVLPLAGVPLAGVPFVALPSTTQPTQPIHAAASAPLPQPETVISKGEAKLQQRKRLREEEVEVVCSIPTCTRSLKRSACKAHERKCRLTVDPTSNASEGISCHVDGSNWLFFEEPGQPGSRYCARIPVATRESADRGCRRPFGTGLGCCNGSKQAGKCKPVIGCQCGATALVPARNGSQRCMCPLAQFEAGGSKDPPDAPDQSGAEVACQ